MMSRKGITPVIAVVLLLLITVGAVASAWGLYQNIISDQSQLDELDAQQRASQSEFSFSSVVENDDGSTQIYLQNTGSRAVNLTSEVELLLSPDGEQGYVSPLVISNQYSNWDASADSSCFNSTAGILEVGNTYNCNTGTNFPNATQTLGIQVNYRNADVDWTYQCRPETSGTTTC